MRPWRNTTATTRATLITTTKIANTSLAPGYKTRSPLPTRPLTFTIDSWSLYKADLDVSWDIDYTPQYDIDFLASQITKLPPKRVNILFSTNYVNDTFGRQTIVELSCEFTVKHIARHKALQDGMYPLIQLNMSFTKLAFCQIPLYISGQCPICLAKSYSKKHENSSICRPNILIQFKVS